MSRIQVSVELDEQIYNKLNEFCQKMGMSPQVAFEVFANRLVREGRYPFPIVKEDFPKSEKDSRISRLARASFTAVQKASVSAISTVNKAHQARREKSRNGHNGRR